MSYWIENDNEMVSCIIKHILTLADQPFKLKDIFDTYSSIKDKVKSYLQNLVWHPWNKVISLFKFGLKINIPSVKIIEKATLVRHDIIHRSGINRDGEKITITEQKINDLFEEIVKFATSIDNQLKLWNIFAKETLDTDE